MSSEWPVLKLSDSTSAKPFFSVSARKAISKEEARRLLAMFDAKFDSLSLFDSFMADQPAYTLEECRQKFRKAKKEDINEKELYEDCKPILPMVFVTAEDGTRSYYLVKDNKEITLVRDADEDSLLSSIQSVPELYAELVNYYETSVSLDKYRKQLPFGTWISKMFVQLKYDIDKRIEFSRVKTISWEHDDFAFKKFDPATLVDGPTPTWDEFTSRLDFPEVFMAWVWTMFDPETFIRQVMWLRGAGNDGKSSVLTALCSIYGNKYSAALKPNSESQQWFFSDVFGKGLVVYGDAQNVHLINVAQIKSLSGGDMVQVEGKNLSSFSGYVKAHVLVSSNPMPRINPDDESHKSRLIKLEVAKPQDNSKDRYFRQRLIEEGNHFLYKCKQVAAKYVVEEGTRIELPVELEEKIARDCVDEQFYILEDFIEQRLEFGENFYCKNADFNKEISNYMIDAYQETSKVKYYIEQFNKKQDKLGFRRDRVRVGGSFKEMVFLGFRIKGRDECTIK